MTSLALTNQARSQVGEAIHQTSGIYRDVITIIVSYLDLKYYEDRHLISKIMELIGNFTTSKLCVFPRVREIIKLPMNSIADHILLHRIGYILVKKDHPEMIAELEENLTEFDRRFEKGRQQRVLAQRIHFSPVSQINMIDQFIMAYSQLFKDAEWPLKTELTKLSLNKLSDQQENGPVRTIKKFIGRCRRSPY